MVDFGFEDVDEACFAELVVVLWTDYEGSRGLAYGTESGCHFLEF